MMTSAAPDLHGRHNPDFTARPEQAPPHVRRRGLPGGDALDIAAPQVERVAFLGVIRVSVVHCRDAAFDVVQDLWGAQAEVLVAGCPFEAEIAPHGPSPRRESAANAPMEVDWVDGAATLNAIAQSCARMPECDSLTAV